MAQFLMTGTKRFINYPRQLLYNMMASLEHSRKKGGKTKDKSWKNAMDACRINNMTTKVKCTRAVKTTMWV